jgi:hypothetical protein
MDEESRAVFEDRFTSCGGFNVPRYVEDTINHYLPFEMALDPDADPPEALGVEPTFYDLNTPH